MLCERKISALFLFLIFLPVSAAIAEDSDKSLPFSGDFRFGYIDRDESGDTSNGASIGGHVSYESPAWHGARIGGGVFTTQKLVSGENDEFFASDGGSYTILGEAYLASEFGDNTLTAGRFALDTPHVDSDDIRMVPNRFQGVMLSNQSLPETTLYAIHLDKWSGVDADIPEKFRAISGSKGVNAAGIVYEGVENLSLQAWHYDASDSARLSYAEVLYETDRYQIGLQWGRQSDRTADKSGPDAYITGITASAFVGDFTFTAAYNNVSGTATNGFGGGPWFTSADDHTIADVEDQEAVTFTAEYAATDRLSFCVHNADLRHGEDETDYSVSFELSKKTTASFVYHDMYDDGHIALFRLDAGF